MRSRNVRRLVVDADVGAHANGADRDPLGPNCRKFLDTFRATRHRIVTSAKIIEEWERRCRHDYAYTWWTSMVSERREDFLKAPEDYALRDNIREAAPGDAARNAMLKDVHLIEAAVATDNTVTSCDEEARGEFRQAADHPKLTRLRRTVWVNPATYASASDWLAQDAPPLDELRLGHKPE